MSEQATPAKKTAEQPAGKATPFGGLMPSEAARLSHAEGSARKTPSDTSDAAIIRKLRQKAARGDVAAARELREWTDKDAEAQAGDEWLSLLAREERALVRPPICNRRRSHHPQAAQQSCQGDVAAARELREWTDKDADAAGAGDEWLPAGAGGA
jgi:hypothetical protein